MQDNIINLIRLVHQRTFSLRDHHQKIGYIGWLGANNLGDEAMFIAAQKILMPSEVIPYGGSKKEAILTTLRLSGKRYFDNVVLGGGTLINPGYSSLVTVALGSDLPVWSLGTGVGSSGFTENNDVDISHWKPLLQRFTKIGVRGYMSGDKLSAIGINNNVEVIGDLALSLTQELSSPPTSPPRIAINIALPQGYSYGYGEAAFVKELELSLVNLMNQDWQLVPIAMSLHDVGPIQQLMDRISLNSLPVNLVTTASAFFELVRPCVCMVAVRLHAAILSACVGVPPIMLGYRDKCRDFMHSMQLEDMYIELNAVDASEVMDRVEQIIHDSPLLRDIILQRAQGWRQRQQEFVEFMHT